MKTVAIDSINHYAFRPVDDCEIELLSFPSACPGMGDREPYQISEGESVALLWVGEQVCFDYGKAFLTQYDGTVETYQGARFQLKITQEMATGIVNCGDDLRYTLAEHCRKQPKARALW